MASLHHISLICCKNRGRLSASSATGLVGMQENDLLSEFFRCMGFLKLTNDRYWVGSDNFLLFASVVEYGGRLFEMRAFAKSHTSTVHRCPRSTNVRFVHVHA